MSEKKTLLFLCISETGHVNPISSIIRELVLNYSDKLNILFHGSEKHKQLISDIGCEHVFTKYAAFDDLLNPGDKSIYAMSNLIDKSRNFFREIIDLCHTRKVDMIAYDQLAFYAKFLHNYFQLNEATSNYKTPIFFGISTTFAFSETINLLTEEEKQFFYIMFKKEEVFKQLGESSKKLNDEFGTTYNFDFESYFLKPIGPNISTVFYELQPKAEQFKALNYQFPGGCIINYLNDDSKADEERFRKVLNHFDPINPSIEQFNASKKLVYVSLGTFFNQNLPFFATAIEAFRLINNNNITVIISLGNRKVYDAFLTKIEQESIQVPSNVFLFPFVPQIEVLERASLFVTHCGMNSTSETIHYGVPVICFPIIWDQPFNALRMCDDLNFGVRFETLGVSSLELKVAIEKVLADKSYLESILVYSALSRQNNGSKNAAKIMFEAIQENY